MIHSPDISVYIWIIPLTNLFWGYPDGTNVIEPMTTKTCAFFCSSVTTGTNSSAFGSDQDRIKEGCQWMRKWLVNLDLKSTFGGVF